MSSLKEITVDGRKVVFYNRSENTRNGFKHISEMFIDGENVSKGTRQYYNRTWEKYQYQSAMKTAVYNSINENRKSIEYSYRLENSINRMTKKHRENLEMILVQDNRLIFLNKIVEQLES